MKRYKVLVREEIYSSVYVDAEDSSKAEDTAYDLYRKIDHECCVDLCEQNKIEFDEQCIHIIDDGTVEVSREKFNLLEK